jgi:cephalosporin-C deacetylase-like acetyl esterase
MRLFASMLLFAAVLAAEPKVAFAVKPDRPDGCYAPGETVTWTIAVTVDGKPAPGTVTYDLRKGGMTTIRKGDLPLTDGKATLTASLDQPGWVLGYLWYKAEGAKKSQQDFAGAIFAPEQIKPSAPEPEDFDAFWQAKIAELHKIPMNVQLTPVDTKDPNIEAWRITLDNIWGTRVQGAFARPKGKKDLPAVLVVEGAGVRGLNPRGVIWRARGGWLAMHIIAHDIKPDQPKEYYDNLSKTTLKDYPRFGREDREKSYFLRMLLACRRSVDYLMEQPEWDGKRLLVTGGSQGGYQSIASAGLCPQVSHIIISVPAGCDHTGELVGRKPGWPGWNAWNPKGIKDKEATLATSKYFDCVNFAKRAKCASLVGVGLIDRTCPAPGVFAMFNQLPKPKKIIPMPDVGHGGIYHSRRGEYSRWSRLWMDAIQQNKPVPVE